jgi:preprotein translocase subunit SecF
MLMGVLIGTYSSVFIATPILVWLDKRSKRRASAVPAGPGIEPTALPRTGE